MLVGGGDSGVWRGARDGGAGAAGDCAAGRRTKGPTGTKPSRARAGGGGRAGNRRAAPPPNRRRVAPVTGSAAPNQPGGGGGGSPRVAPGGGRCALAPGVVP